jgi:hypothetical protein
VPEAEEELGAVGVGDAEGLGAGTGEGGLAGGVTDGEGDGRTFEGRVGGVGDDDREADNISFINFVSNHIIWMQET